MIHVDEWIDTPSIHITPDTRGKRYARWFLLIKRLPAYMHKVNSLNFTAT